MLASAVLLVDGYNVLRSSGRYGQRLALADDFSSDVYNAARDALISDVATFAGRDFAATVVFDGSGNPSSDGRPQSIAGIKVIFSAAGSSADTVIEGLAQAAVGKGKRVTVVTSDAQMQWTVLGKGVTRMSAAGFASELELLDDERSADDASETPKTTLAERIDPEALAKLKGMLGQS